MTIKVNKPNEKVNVCEDGKTEFKSSIFFLPSNNMPDVKQMREIAASVAAFMNAEGGVLYIGIADDGTISGIEDDLDFLAYSAEAVEIWTSQFNDTGFVYDGSTDKYQTKIRHLLQAFLGHNHINYLGEIQFAKMGGADKKLVCRVNVNKCCISSPRTTEGWKRRSSSGAETERFGCMAWPVMSSSRNAGRSQSLRRSQSCGKTIEVCRLTIC